MNIKKDVPIYVLSVSILAASLIFATQNKSTETSNQSPTANYVTEDKYKSELKVVVTELINATGQIESLKRCVNDMAITLNNPSVNHPVIMCR